MSDFERTYQIDPQREERIPFEKHLSIEKQDVKIGNSISTISEFPKSLAEKIESDMKKEIEQFRINQNEKSTRKDSKKKAKRNHA